MMDKIAEALKKSKTKAFVPYIMAGDGGLDKLGDQLRFLQACGCQAIEIGIPFSDPVADGPTIQRAGIRALSEGTTLKKVLAALTECKDDIHIPLILMSYLNPLVAYGVERFAEDAAGAGVAGCIIPDLPLEEEDFIFPALDREGISLIRLVTLTTPYERIKQISKDAKGFIYAVTVTGTTGARKAFSDELSAFLTEVKKVSSIPVLAGFGVSTKEHVEEVCKHCDGVIVGSRIVELLQEEAFDEIRELIQTTESVVV